ncbi:MAG TPA: DNA repair protein RadA, partial [Alcanivorax sp.]|nr:DNA repair protein RadA [Alcanivorax sp.]HBP67724.1 DNA repair protein RadA [Alcanivorax sp.]
FSGQLSEVRQLNEIALEDSPRISAGMDELDRVLGGGLVPGSAILLGGHPGAGKSTLLLQVLCRLADREKCFYITGEESLAQVAMRADRLKLPKEKLRLAAETDVEQILELARKEQPRLLVVDSIQVMYLAGLQSAPGSVAQVREGAAALTRFAKQTGTVLLLVGHVTKDGTLAGPKVLEHMIDCSLMLEGSADARFRTLRGLKNRFGAVNELGVFAMTGEGLKEVKNPSAIFLNRADDIAPGSLVTVVWEGTRPLLVELQALVDASHFGNPRRVCVGLEANRLAMLLAVLHRHGGIQVGDQDVFANVVGGVKVAETAADLALVLAIVSSFRDRPLGRDLVVFGEIGLSGEIRPVPQGQERLYEAVKHGFKRAIIPKANKPRQLPDGVEVIAVSTLAEALEQL